MYTNKREYRLHSRPTLKKTNRKPKNHKSLTKLAIAFTIALIAAIIAFTGGKYTLDAKNARMLEEKSHKLNQTLQQLESTDKQVKDKDKQIEEIQKQLEETNKQLQAKKSKAVAYAAALGNGSCTDWMEAAGIPLNYATNKLIVNESGCRTNAVNPTSGACGIPQAYPCSKLPCPLDNTGAVCQLKWMDNYVKTRYGSWESALTFWYAQCGTPQHCWY